MLKNLASFFLAYLPCILFAQNKISLSPVMSGLTIPVDIVFDNTDRMYVLEKTGKIKTPENNTNVVFLDITDRVNSGANERGLLGMAFHPDYKNNGYLFVNYTGGNGQTVIARYTRSASDSLKAEASTEKVLMTIAQPFNNHNAGDLNFGPDGYLYIAMGDGGSGGDPGNRSQNPKERLGKMLRIDVNTDATHYLIPEDNPYAGNADTLGEIWAMGLRNPWRFSFDKKTNDLWIADVGQRKWEEVNYIPYSQGAKYNFGWRCYEGFEKYDYSQCNDKTVFYPPIHVYANNSGGEGCSVTGGYVYRGEEIPYLEGHYIYGDFCSGKMWRLKRDECYNVLNELIYTVGPNELSSFGQNNKGELFLALLGEGKVYEILPTCSLSVTIDSLTPASCLDASDGSVNFTVSGVSAYTFELNNNSNPNALLPGNYSYKVTETGTGCSQTGCFDIGVFPNPEFCTSFIIDTFCGFQYKLNTSHCQLQSIDSLHVIQNGLTIYSGNLLPDSITIPGEDGIFGLKVFQNGCSYTIDTFLQLTAIFFVGNTPLWTIDDTVITVKGEFGPFEYVEMYRNDTLFAISPNGIFHLPAGSYGTFYFVGIVEIGQCRWQEKSGLLVLSSTEVSELEQPWFFPNPASNSITTAQTDLQKAIICDLLGRELITWEKPEQVLSISTLTNGIYILLIQKNGQIFRQNIIIQKF